MLVKAYLDKSKAHEIADAYSNNARFHFADSTINNSNALNIQLVDANAELLLSCKK